MRASFLIVIVACMLGIGADGFAQEGAARVSGAVLARIQNSIAPL